MPRAATLLALVCVLMFATTMPGCQGPGLISRSPLEPDSVVVTRRVPGPDGAVAAEPQRLQIDLIAGRASLADPDGRVSPLQIDAQTITALRADLSGRAWQGRRLAARGAASPVSYTLTAYAANAPVAETAVWYVPSQRALPPVLQRVNAVFEQADRRANPISERVDLLE